MVHSLLQLSPQLVAQIPQDKDLENIRTTAELILSLFIIIQHDKNHFIEYLNVVMLGSNFQSVKFSKSLNPMPYYDFFKLNSYTSVQMLRLTYAVGFYNIASSLSCSASGTVVTSVLVWSILIGSDRTWSTFIDGCSLIILSNTTVSWNNILVWLRQW